MKKNIILFIIALISFGKLAAQRNAALFFENGQKRFDGEYYFAFKQTKEAFSQEVDPMFSEYLTAEMATEYNGNGTPVIIYKGKITFYYDDGKKKAEGTFVEGIREGKFMMWYNNGKPAAEKYYDKGLPMGTWKYWYDDGQLMANVPYLKFTDAQRDSLYATAVFEHYNSRMGRSLAFELDDDPKRQALFEADMRARQQRDDMIGREINDMLRGLYRNVAYYGMIDGTALFYLPDGRVQYSIQFVKGLASGTWSVRGGRDTTMLNLGFTKGILKSVNGMSLDAYAEALRLRNEEAQNNMVFTTVQQMPEFPGGTAAMQEFIKNNLRPLKDTISGRPVIRFVVQTDGSLKDITVQRSLSKEADEEAIRMLKSMPPWKPGKQNGRVVNVFYTISVKFGE